MADKSKIEWTDATWSPVTGCTKVSQGCKNCYAEREVVTRWSKNPKSVWFGREFTDVQCHADKLDQPLHWKKPRRIFVCPRADLFHEDIDDSFLDRVFAVMALTPQHTFQVLTKRAKRMQAYIGGGGRGAAVFDFMRNSELGYWAGAEKVPPQSWPLPNVWLGVSAENQQMAEERIPLLLQTPAAVHWISAEPLLGEIDLTAMSRTRAAGYMRPLDGRFNKINWVVAGGESGPNARPSHPEWFRGLRDQCEAAGVAYFFKQWGEYAPADRPHNPKKTVVMRKDGSFIDHPFRSCDEPNFSCFARYGKRAAGRLLDGREHSEFPR